MKHIMLLLMCGLLMCSQAMAQYTFPDCGTPYAAGAYQQGDMVSYEGNNYTAKYYTTTAPGSGEWTNNGPCGADALGADYGGPQRIIGYLPTWQGSWDRASFDPSVATHINISFLEFIQNNNDYTSATFSSVAFKAKSVRDVDSVLFDLGVLADAQNAGTTVSVALGGAIDYSFLWLMDKYYNDDAKLDEIAELIKDFVVSRNLDGVDLDMEAWWQDAAINKGTDEGGRIRGDKWGGTDAGPHPAGLGLTRLTQKLRQKMPNKLISAAVFGTSWYGNNYDDEMVQYMDWLGLMTYDFTGSWNESSEGPHSSLYKVPQGYVGQTANNPIYSAEDALEYWMGFAEPAWNHDGGFAVPKAKLAIGVPCYGYDMATRKSNGGNGYEFVPYKDIVAQYPNAPTSYDPNFASQKGGYISQDGKKLYYNTPELAATKINYTHDFGHQGVIIWELTMDAPYNGGASLLKAMNEAKAAQEGGNLKPAVSLSLPATAVVGDVVTFTATASDADGTIAGVEFFVDGTSLGVDNTAPYAATWTATLGSHAVSAVATDDAGANGTSSGTINVTDGTDPNNPPAVSVSAPASATKGDVVTFTALATDSDGSVTTVEFLVNGVSVGADATAPYSASWTAAEGTYSVTAKATDDDGAQTSSSSATLVVSGTGGGACDGVPAHVAGQVYLGGDQVVAVDPQSVESALWEAKWWTNTAPGSSDWQFVQLCSGGGGGTCGGVADYRPGEAYNGAEQVAYQGNIYEAKWWTNTTPGSDDTWLLVGPCPQAREGAITQAFPAQASLYPNPAQAELSLALTLSQGGTVQITLINMQGQQVAEVFRGALTSGSHTLNYSVAELPAGAYFLHIQEEGTQQVLRLFKD